MDDTDQSIDLGHNLPLNLVLTPAFPCLAGSAVSQNVPGEESAATAWYSTGTPGLLFPPVGWLTATDRRVIISAA